MPSATYPHTGQGVLVAKATPHKMIHQIFPEFPLPSGSLGELLGLE